MALAGCGAGERPVGQCLGRHRGEPLVADGKSPRQRRKHRRHVRLTKHAGARERRSPRRRDFSPRTEPTSTGWSANGNILSSPLAGGSPVTLEGGNPAQGGSDYTIAIVASAGRAYYADAATGQLVTATGGTASLNDRLLGRRSHRSRHRRRRALLDQRIYDFQMRLGASCGTPAVVWNANATSLAVDATNLYWINSGTLNNSSPNVWEYAK